MPTETKTLDSTLTRLDAFRVCATAFAEVTRGFPFPEAKIIVNLGVLQAAEALHLPPFEDWLPVLESIFDDMNALRAGKAPGGATIN